MKVTIIAVGRVKEEYFRKAIQEYEKRLSRYCRLEIIQVDDEKTPDHASQADEELIKEKEAQRILKHIKEDAFVYSLEIKGKRLDSVAFSKEIEQLGIQGKSHIQFIIGGSLGLHESVTKVSNRSLSFSEMTFPHQLMRVILLEQVYRGYRIIAGEPYHK